MVVVCCRYFVSVIAAAVLLLGPNQTIAAITSAPAPTTTLPATCEFRTINYITDTLPQLCGKSSWSHTNVMAATKVADAENSSLAGDVKTAEPLTITGSAQDSIPSPTSTEAAQQISSVTATSTAAAETVAAEEDDLHDSSFLSFEEWKAQTLKKAGQDNPHIGNKRSGERHRDPDNMAQSLEGFGDEGEIDLGFAFGKPVKEKETKPDVQEDECDSEEDQGVQRRDSYRSNDAGKTCKERFNFASFDAGATVLKTHAGAKNSKAILVENKDTYMLSKCSTKNKFLIIELSEDIWIDTLVLASYEFFSSMIRTFQVSVSEKYPVKMDKWKIVGTYEARNSREIQAFLIENPQIWARYIRVEFLTHYGNEFYCPLSLVRVHGARMLDSWKESEPTSEPVDSSELMEEEPEPAPVIEPVKEEISPPHDEPKESEAFNDDTASNVSEHADDATVAAPDKPAAQTPKIDPTCPYSIRNTTLVLQLLLEPEAQKTCALSEAPVTRKEQVHPSAMVSNSSSIQDGTTTSSAVSTALPANGTMPTSVSTSSEAKTTEHSSQAIHSSSSPSSSAQKPSSETSGSIASSKAPNATASQKSKTSTTGSATSALPTIQESFFKAVSRRLQLLEANSTLSLGYIEEQSRILREAFSKVEKRQLQKTTNFLDTLNSTVLAELRTFRQQYDEIWQSTVISLEGQREESRREILAISSRLNILADEVVFQKRMSIIQSVLLLLCLALVIFSRVSGSSLDIPLLHSRARAMGLPLSPLESPPQSPSPVYNPQNADYNLSPLTEQEEWLEPSPSPTPSPEGNHIRSKRARSPSMDDAPPTPISSYSRSEESATPPSSSGRLANSNGDIQNGIPHEEVSVPAQARAVGTSSAWDLDDETSQLSSSSAPFKRRRGTVLRQRSSSAMSDDTLEVVGVPLLATPEPEDSIPNDATTRKPLPPLPVDSAI